MNWKKIREPDKGGKSHTHFLSGGYRDTDKRLTIMFGDEGVVACMPDGSHYVLEWNELIETLPEVKT